MEYLEIFNKECALDVDGPVCTPKKEQKKIENLIHAEKIAGIDMGKIKKEGLMPALKYHYNCPTEDCVLTQEEIIKELGVDKVASILKTYFKPLGPKDTTEWYSDKNIDETLNQLARKFDDEENKFYHVPFQMRDFQEKRTELTTMDWEKKYAKGYRTFGVAINTDYSRGRGEHWFAIFGDFRDNAPEFTVEYFNSSGELPLPEISSWLKDFKNKVKLHKPIKDVIVTRLVNQSNNYACGTYTVSYNAVRLCGLDYKWFAKNKLGDKLMGIVRNNNFRNNNRYNI
jgi:hypothetical protein